MIFSRIAPQAARLSAVILSSVASIPAQEVIKPTTTTTLQTRLPAPASVAARQLSDGRIEVRWTPVEGAVRYQLTRSVPPSGAQVVQPDPVQATYVDADVRVGSTYYYLVAGYGADGTVGLKAGSNPVTATIPVGGATQPQLGSVSAQLLGSNRAHVSWNASAGTSSYAVISRVVMATTGASTFDLARVPLAANTFDDTFSLPPGTQFSYRLRVEGQTTAGVMSNTLTVPAEFVGTPAVGTVATSGVTLKVAAPITLRSGASVGVGASAAGARWLSMNESVATVDASGNVAGRSAGTAQIVALSTEADGTLRVTSVTVTVTA